MPVRDNVEAWADTLAPATIDRWQKKIQRIQDVQVQLANISSWSSVVLVATCLYPEDTTISSTHVPRTGDSASRGCQDVLPMFAGGQGVFDSRSVFQNIESRVLM